MHHFPLDLFPGRLVQLIHRRADGPCLCSRHTAHGEYSIQDAPVIQLDCDIQLQAAEGLHNDTQDLCVRHHGVKGARNVKVALVKLAEPASANSGLVAAVYLGDLVALDLLDVCARGEPAGKGDGEVVAQGAELAALVLQVVEELGVLAVFVGEDIAQLKHGSVEGDAAVELEDVADGLAVQVVSMA